jgi:hypothetical protein
MSRFALSEQWACRRWAIWTLWLLLWTGACVGTDVGNPAGSPGDVTPEDSGAADAGATDMGATDMGGPDDAVGDAAADTGLDDIGGIDIGEDAGSCDPGPCDAGEDTSDATAADTLEDPTEDAGPLELAWDFDDDAEGWTGGFADYPDGEETFYELSFGQDELPEEVGPGGGLRIVGNNHSDDLFMFVTREVSDLPPSAEITIDVRVRIATNAPADCVGVGGAPGTSVYLKIGAVPFEPDTTLDDMDWHRMNLDKGNQATGGEDMEVVGDIANTRTCPDETYELKELLLEDFTVTADESGRVWLVVGTDSGFEGKTTLYYDEIELTID